MSALSERGLYWSDAVSKQRASGLPAAQWCRSEGLSYNSFCAWRTRLNNASRESAEWVSVTDVSPTTSSLTLRIGAAELTLSSGFDPQLLRDVIAALDPRC